MMRAGCGGERCGASDGDREAAWWYIMVVGDRDVRDMLPGKGPSSTSATNK